MVGGNGLNNFGRFTKSLCIIGTYSRVSPLYLMIHRLSNIVKQPCPFGLFNIHFQFSGHYASQMSNFNRMLKNILREACSILETSKEINDFRMKIMNPNIAIGARAARIKTTNPAMATRLP